MSDKPKYSIELTREELFYISMALSHEMGRAVDGETGTKLDAIYNRTIAAFNEAGLAEGK